MKKIFLLSLLLASTLLIAAEKKPVLHADIHLTPHTHIKAGTPIQLKATIKNTGTKESQPGEVFIRYALLEPLHEHEESILFETEKISFKSIQPSEEISLTFEKKHILPSIFDYIRQDWQMRQYEAILTSPNEKNQSIGRTALLISAHFYQGPQLSPDKN